MSTDTVSNPDRRKIREMIPSWLREPTTHVVKPWMKIAAGIIIIFIIVIIGMTIYTIGDIDASIYGFWEVDGNFADKAQLDAMYMYINAPRNDGRQSIGIGGEELSIYMFLKADSTVRVNEVIKTKVSRRSFRPDKIQKYAIDFGKSVSIIPRNISAEYDHVTQMLILRDSNRIYARLFKKPEVSFYCTSASLKSTTNAKNKSHTSVDDIDDDSSFSDDDIDIPHTGLIFGNGPVKEETETGAEAEAETGDSVVDDDE